MSSKTPAIIAIVFAAVLCPLAVGLASDVPLTKPLWLWKKEIEARGRGTIILARAFTDTQRNEMTLPPDIEDRDVLKTYFLDEAFVGQFYRSHAMNINTQSLHGLLYFVVLNMAKAAEWQGVEDAVIAHEFGHVDLATRGYAAWVHQTSALACMDTQSTDIVQHVLIREEIARRSIDYDTYWIRNLNAALDRMESEPAPKPGDKEDPCQSSARVALWTDVRLGMSAAKWKRKARFEEVMASRWPAHKPAVDRIEVRLNKPALWTQQRYLEALYFVREVLDFEIHPPGKSAL